MSPEQDVNCIYTYVESLEAWMGVYFSTFSTPPWIYHCTQYNSLMMKEVDKELHMYLFEE